MPEDPRDLVFLAEATPLAKAPVVSLAEAAPPERLLEALDRALDAARTHAATVLALAIGVAGAKIPAPLLIRLAPDLDSMGYLPVLAGIVEGDRLAALLDLAATDRLSWEREAMVLFLAARLLDGTEPPPRLTARLRSLLREPLSPEARMLASMAATVLSDREVNTLTGEPMLEFVTRHDGAKNIADELWRFFTAPVVDSLPEHAARPSYSGHTVTRTEPKIGRNDPCPCGSGRKYKKCCAGKEPAAPVPRSLVEQFQDAGPGKPRVRQQLFERMRPGDIEQLQPEQLTVQQLTQGLRTLVVLHRWDAAERFMAALATRSDPSVERTLDDQRSHLVHLALEAGQLDLAERQMALANPNEQERSLFDVQMALARKSPDALSRLEAVLQQGHAGDPVILMECAFALLHHMPALGILAARGAMSVDRLLDADELLNAIGRARDRLGIAAAEPWEEIFDLLLDARSGAGGGEDHGPEIEGLRAELRASRDRARRLDEELGRRERQLEKVSGERERLAAAVAESQQDQDRGRVAELERERQRLRSKIEELKGEVTEGASQRAELRRELARSADERARNAVAGAARETPDELAADDAEGDAVESRPRRILIPQFSTAASRSLASVPARVASDALQAAARLAGGDAHAWSGAKHMKRVPEILSVRVGRSWRLLFRLFEERLEILDLVHRRDLDTALTRMTRA